MVMCGGRGSNVDGFRDTAGLNVDSRLVFDGTLITNVDGFRDEEPANLALGGGNVDRFRD